jgi:hypothetical protein
LRNGERDSAWDFGITAGHETSFGSDIWGRERHDRRAVAGIGKVLEYQLAGRQGAKEPSDVAAPRLSRVDDHRRRDRQSDRACDRAQHPSRELPAFLAMYFLFLWIAWVLALRVTQPRAALR